MLVSSQSYSFSSSSASASSCCRFFNISSALYLLIFLGADFLYVFLACNVVSKFFYLLIAFLMWQSCDLLSDLLPDCDPSDYLDWLQPLLSSDRSFFLPLIDKDSQTCPLVSSSFELLSQLSQISRYFLSRGINQVRLSFKSISYYNLVSLSQLHYYFQTYCQYYYRQLGKMKKLLGLDASYQKLNYLRFTDEKFGGMPLLQIRNFFKSACRSDNRIDLFKDMTRVLEQQNQSSYYTIKAMIFLTMLINEAEGNMLDQLQDTINKTVNILWEKQAHRNAKIIQKRAYSKSGSSYEKTVGWIKDKLSVTKANKHKRSQSTATPVVTDKNQQGIQMQKSIEDILHENIARPYCKYVLKLMSSDLWELLLQQQKKMSMQQIWKVVNLLNSVLEISKSFVHLLRYFKKQTLNMVAVLIKIIDYQLRLLYPIAISSLNFSVNELNEQFIELAGRREEYNYVEKLYELVDRYELRQIKEILRELSIINELIAGIYIGKYTYPIVTSEGITYPQVLREDKRFELIFEILKKVDSNKEKVTRRESRSKEKLMRAASPKHRTVLVHKDQKGSNLAQKRLKIIHSKNNHQLSEDNTEIINATLSVNTANQTTIQCPKQQGQRSTFRQMRLNTTSQGVHLESTNTRRLRL